MSQNGCQRVGKHWQHIGNKGLFLRCSHLPTRIRLYEIANLVCRVNAPGSFTESVLN